MNPDCRTHSLSVAELIADGAGAIAGAGIPPSEAQTEARLLFQHASDISAEAIIGNTELTTTKAVATKFAYCIARRVTREPLPYIVGAASFYGRSFRVTPEVLIPRPETELLIELAVRFVRQHEINAPRICDAGTGSGVVAISIALELPDAVLVACDIDPDALKVARQNASMHHVSPRIMFLEADMTNVADIRSMGQFDIVVSNPPYIPSGRLDCELEPEVSQWEPRRALDGGGDGMGVLEPLIRQLPRLLTQSRMSAAFVEIDHSSADRCLDIVAEVLPGATGQVQRDLAGHKRILHIRT